MLRCCNSMPGAGTFARSRMHTRARTQAASTAMSQSCGSINRGGLASSSGICSSSSSSASAGQAYLNRPTRGRRRAATCGR